MKPETPRIGQTDTRNPAPPHLLRAFLHTGASASEPTRPHSDIGEAELRLGPRRLYARLFADTSGRPWTLVRVITRPGAWGGVPPKSLPAIHRLMLYTFAEELGAGGRA